MARRGGGWGETNWRDGEHLTKKKGGVNRGGKET